MSYPSTVLADAPVHYWRLAEPGGNLLHDLGSSKLFLTNTDVAKTPLGYSGVASDGGSGYFDAGSSFFHRTAQTIPVPGSVEMWVWFDDTNDTFIYTFFGWDASGAANTISIFLDGSGKLNVQWGATQLTGPTVISKQHWHHLVVTQTTTTTIFYVDASVYVTGASAAAAGSAIIYLGRNAANTHSLSGLLCEVATYSAVLSPSRVTAHFAAADAVLDPVFQLPGGFNGSTGGTTPSSAQLTDILNAVQKTY